MKNQKNPTNKSMSKRSNSFNRARSRRQTSGIGAIIGGVILAAILFTSVFLYFLVQAQTQSERGKTDVQAARVDEAKRLETIKVSSLTSPITNGTGYDLIPIKIENTGSLPVNATYAIVARSDDGVDRQVNPLQLVSQNNQSTDQVINPGGSAVFLVASKDQTLDNTKTYHIDVVSGRGNIIGTQWPPAGPSITISGAPSLVVQRGYSAQATVTITSEDGFSGAASLSVTGLPAGVTSQFNTNPVTVPNGGTATSNLLLSASTTATLGTFPLTITASSGSIQKTTTINLTVVDTGSGTSVPDFYITSNHNPLAVQPGTTGSTQIQVTSLNGFNAAVSLSMSGSYPGITASALNPATVTPPVQGSATSSLSFTLDPTVAPGTYVYAITGTSGAITRSVDLSVVVLTSGSGERNVGENIGSGTYAIYKGMDPADPTKLQFRTIQAGGGITITETPADTLLISAGGGPTGDITDGKSLGCDPTYNSQANNPPASPNCANVYAGKSGTLIQFYSLRAGVGITLTKDVVNGNISISGPQGQNATNTGSAIYSGMNANNLSFRTVQGTGGITTNYSADGKSVVIDGSNAGASRTQVGIVQGTGSLQLDFKSLGAIFPQFQPRNGVDQTGWLTKSGNATGYPAFMLPTGPQTYLVERVRNLDQQGFQINLGRSSGLTISQGKCTSGQCQPVYVCNASVDANGNLVQGTVSALNDPTTFVTIPATPVTAGQYVGFRDVLLCSHEQDTLNPWWVQAQMTNINSAFMVARGQYGGTNYAYAQTIPYQSIIVANGQQSTNYAQGSVADPAIIGCLLSTNTNTACTTPTTVGGPAGAKYQDTVANVRAGSQIWIHLNSNCNCGYNVSWVYPTNGLVRNLVTGATLNANGNINGAITLPTTMADGVTPMAPGYYTIMLTTGYTGPDSNSNYNQGVYYFTFRVV